MKRIYSLLFIACICSAAIGQTKPATTTPPGKQSPKATATPPATIKVPETMNAASSDAPQMNSADMKAWMTYMTPGPMHDMLAKFNGEWKEEVTFWMKPDAPPSTSISTCLNQMILGNRYQQSNHKGDMGGMPFEGLGYVGYDNAKNLFMSTWIDNMGTGIMFMEGRWDEQASTIHFTGNMVDPMSGQEVKVREEFKLVDDNHQTLEMYMTQKGKEYKSMEIKFTR
jgi:hypothetical protein